MTAFERLSPNQGITRVDDRLRGADAVLSDPSRSVLDRYLVPDGCVIRVKKSSTAELLSLKNETVSDNMP